MSPTVISMRMEKMRSLSNIHIYSTIYSLQQLDRSSVAAHEAQLVELGEGLNRQA